MLITLLATYLFFCYPQIFWLIVLILWFCIEFCFDPVWACIKFGIIFITPFIVYSTFLPFNVSTSQCLYFSTHQPFCPLPVARHYLILYSSSFYSSLFTLHSSLLHSSAFDPFFFVLYPFFPFHPCAITPPLCF